MKPVVLFVLGGPGCGKGTQCKKLSDDLGYIHQSAGDLLRAERAKKGSENAELINNYIKDGKIVPVEITVNLIKTAMKENGWEKSKFQIDGFPRNDDNYDGFYKVFGDEADVRGVLYLDLSEEKMMERIKKRAEEAGEGNQRSDDNVESIKKRFGVFQNETMPVIEKFKSKNALFYVNSDNTIDGVAADVREYVNKISESRLYANNKLMENPIDLKEKKDSEPKLSWKALRDELVYGTFAGLGICVAGHPFDTMKTRMQMDNSNLLTTVKNIMFKEGPISFYKGVGGPIIAIPFVNAIVFATFETSGKLIQKYTGETGKFTLSTAAIAGMIAGIVQSPINCAAELAKCKLQMQKTGPKVYNNTFDCLVKLVRQNGLRAPTQGLVSTIWRDIPAYGAQFCAYVAMNNMFENLNGTGETTLSQNFISGGVAGFSCWLWSYPQDCVKTRIQCQPQGHYRSILYDGGLITAHKEIYNTLGPRGFWVGFSAVCGRAVLGNAVGFLCWETSKKYF